MRKVQLISLALTSLFWRFVLTQDYTDECPTLNGFFADAVQCDRYYECKNGEIFDRYCPDGLVYDESSIAFAKCSFPFSVDCSTRPELQPAQPTALCPRQNGYFPHEDPTVCDKFYFCVDGVPNAITCPASLIFSPDLGQCAYSDQITRKGCSSSEVFQFDCPKIKDSTYEHPLFPDANDCQYFYICIDGQARRNGCQTGQVFNKATRSCDVQENVENDPICKNWYNETVLDAARVPASKPGFGTPLTDQQIKDRVVVRRRKPRPSQQQVSVSQSETLSTGTLRRPTDGQRPTVPPTVDGFQPLRNQVRTRVRRPQQNQVAQEIVEPDGPPTFALSNDEDIQQFRDSNAFAPQSGGGRLTVLSGQFQQPRPIPEDSFVPNPSFPDPESNPIRSFPASAAVPQQQNFGDRFKSRRPPQFDPRNPEQQQVRGQRPSFENFEPQNEQPTVSRQRPPFNNFEPQNDQPTGSRQRPPLDNFQPQVEQPSVGRQRLQVTQIRVNPQQPNDDYEDELLDIDAFRRVASQFSRQRGSQQLSS